MANTYKNKPSYETACRGKTTYISGFKAHVALRALSNRHRRSANQNKLTRLEVYRCPYGPHWNIGSTDS